MFCQPVYNTAMMNSQTPVLMVESVAQSIAFYTTFLKFNVIIVVPAQHPEPVFAILKCGHIDLMFQQRESFEVDIPFLKGKAIGGTFCIYIKVDDAAALYESLKDSVTIVSDIHDTFYHSTEFSIIDNSGYILSFAEHRDDPVPT
jgi:lactoylglutathione lyase